jgi:DNA-binding IclR family transcriptional regulator
MMKRTVKLTPYSSVVGQSVQVIDERGVVALISIMVPQPHLDYKEIAVPLAEEIVKALEAMI